MCCALHPNLSEIKAWIQPKEPSCEGNEHLCQRWVDIHEEATSNILRGKPTKMHLVKPMQEGVNEVLSMDCIID